MAGAEPQDLEEAGIIPLLANGLAESTGVLLRVHVGGGEELLTGATVGREQVETAPRIDMYGEGLFTLAVVALGGAGMQDLVWCVSNIPNFEFGMGLQVASYQLPAATAPLFHLVLLLYRQPGDEPQDIRLPGSEAMPHKLNEAGAPTDQMLGAARAAFDAKTFAAQHSLGLPVVVHYLQVLS